MIFNWKQFFCEHIYKTIESTYLGTKRLQDSHMGTIRLYHNYSYYAQKQVCLKCSKEHIIEVRRLDI